MAGVLFRLARSALFASVIGWVFAHMSFLIPVDRLRETPALIAFYHPKPSYPVHILIVPKLARHDLTVLTSEDSPFMIDLFAVVRELVAELGLHDRGYRLIANGGPYQDVPQLHFHLISE